MYLSKIPKTQYVWNSSRTNDTNVIRSVIAVARQVKPPLDMELLPTPTLNPDNNQYCFKYLRYVSTKSQFVIYVLNILIEERRTSHRKCWNKGKQQQNFKVGDVVKAHTQIQFSVSTASG